MGGMQTLRNRAVGRLWPNLVEVDPQTGHVLKSGHEQSRFRTRRFRHFLAMVDTILSRQGRCRILDLGGTPAYWAAFDQDLQSRNVSLTIVNLLPQTSRGSGMTCVAGDATGLAQLASMSFDIVHSNSVIEHVGSWDRMVAFASEAHRLAPTCFIQTPNFWFPLDLHARIPFFHWLPLRLRVALLMRSRCGFYPRARTAEEALAHARDARCLTRSDLRKLFADGTVRRERFLGLTKSWVVVRD